MGFALGAVLNRMGFIVAVRVVQKEYLVIAVESIHQLVLCRQKVLHPLCFEAEFRQIDHLPFGDLPIVVFIGPRKVHRQLLEVYQHQFFD